MRRAWRVGIGSGCGFAIDTAKDEVQLLGFAVKSAGFVSQCWFGSSDHPEKELGFLCLFPAAADDVAEIFLREAFVRLTVVCPDTCSAAGELIDQPVVVRTTRNFLQEANDVFAKNGSSFLKVKGMTRCQVAGFRNAP